MATAGFDRALALVLRHEGGYVDHPADPGGATNLGITQATLAAWRGAPVGKVDVRALGRDEAAAIYRVRYWDAVSGDELPAGIDLAVFDAAVNSGPDRALRWLQAVLSVPVDGVIGPVTRRALQACDAADVIGAFSLRRLAFLQGLATWPTFGRGWSRRVRETEAAARETLAAAAIPPTVPVKSPEIGNPEEISAMQDQKSVLESKTVWANLIGLASLLLPLVGVPAGAVDANGLAEAAAQAVAAVSFIASSVFRISASRRLMP